MTSRCNFNSCRCGQEEGERRKADAFAMLAAHREIVIRRAQRALLTVLLETGSATADDIRDLVDLPPGIGPKLFGAAPGPLARAGIIAPAGFTKTCRPVAHSRPVTVWRLADRVAARCWLWDHPDLEDPGDGNYQGFLFPMTANEPTPLGTAGGVGVED